MIRKKLLIAALLALVASSFNPVAAQRKTTRSSPTPSIEDALSAFITAFENLDWQKFRACFSTNATIFHPSAPNIRRVESPDQFERVWLDVFEGIKKESGRTSPPYMNLRPLDLRVENLSENVALATFHLSDDGTLGRRTIVFKREPDGWKIVHIHASTIAMP